MDDRDFANSPPGYLDLRIITYVERTGNVTKAVESHVQSLIDSGTIYHTFHDVRGLAREMRNFGRVTGYPQVPDDPHDESAYAYREIMEIMDTMH